MKKISFFGLLLTLFAFVQVAKAQVKIPPMSSKSKIVQGIGIHNVTLTYQRPNVNGRVIFGGLVPYGEIWRTGANGIPVVVFEESVSLQGNVVPAGTYGILTIPNKESWTIIVTKDYEQWGAYTYDSADDILRFDVKSEKLNEFVETFTMSFGAVTTTSAVLSMAWENTQVNVEIKVDQQAEILASIEEGMKTDKKPYFQAAQYYYLNDLDINQAAIWAELAEKENDNLPWYKYWRARIQLKQGDRKAAAETARRGIQVAKELQNEEYIKLNTAVLNEATK